MYKLLAFATLLAVATAAPGLIAAPYASYAAPVAAYAAPVAASPWGHGIAASPWGHGIVSSPLISAGATSYANTVRIASPAVVAAPAYAHAPLVAAHGW